MKRHLLAAAAVATLAIAGCKADTSGVPGDLYMDELSTDQVTTFCAWGVQKQGGGGKHACDWGTQTIMTIEQCQAKAWPHCRLSLFEDCANSLSGVCDRGPTSACTSYGTCAVDHPAAGPDAGVDLGDAGG